MERKAQRIAKEVLCPVLQRKKNRKSHKNNTFAFPAILLFRKNYSGASKKYLAAHNVKSRYSKYIGHDWLQDLDKNRDK